MAGALAMKFTVVTILPELVEPALVAGVVGRVRRSGTITVDTIDPPPPERWR